MDGQSVSGQDSIYVSAVIDKNTNDVIIKVVNASGNTINKMITINGAKKLTPAAIVTVLKSNSVLDVNSFATPEAVSPATSTVQVKGNKLAASLPAYSFSVYRIGMK
jgi:alpha-L-arabinofuranosidase